MSTARSPVPILRRLRWVAAGLLLLLAAASVSISVGRTLDVADGAGRPMAAYVAYRYQGSVPNFVHPIRYDASEIALTQSGPDGRVAFPVAVHVHWPFPMRTHPSLQIEMAYVPALHNAVGRLGRLTTSRAGEFQFAAADWRLALNDVSDRPELWLRTLSILTSTIQDLMPAPIRPGSRLRDRDPATADLALELIGRLGEEYDAFLVRHGEVPRPMPAMPPMNTADDERRWAEANAADLARDPTWGRRVRRLLDDDLAAFRKYALELR